MIKKWKALKDHYRIRIRFPEVDPVAVRKRNGPCKSAWSLLIPFAKVEDI